MNRLQRVSNNINSLESLTISEKTTMQISQEIQKVLKTNLYQISPVVNTIDRKQLSLAYSPGVGQVCLEVQKNPQLVNIYTLRNRSVAIVSDGSMLNSQGKKFMPIMDWFIVQIKHYSGYEAFPFVIRKGTNVENFFNDLSTTYGTILYLDDQKIYSYPKDTLVIFQNTISQFTKTPITDCEKTSHLISSLKKYKISGIPSQKQMKFAFDCPLNKKTNTYTEFIVPQGSLVEKAVKFHEHFEGKIFIELNFTDIQPLKKLFTEENLRKLIQKRVYSKTSKLSAIVSDGTAILGLGDIGPVAGLPVMQGKSLLFKIFGDVDVVPLCFYPKKNSQDEIKMILDAISFYKAVNLEDIKAPQCFEIEEGVNNAKLLPVFHDDQHGTAIVTLAALISALKLAKKEYSKLKIVVNGAGAAGITITYLLQAYFAEGQANFLVLDSKGIIYKGRKEGMNNSKEILAEKTNIQRQKGGLEDAVKGCDVFIGVSAAGALKGEWVKTMNEKSIIFAMANPTPQICPTEAKKNGAFIYGSGRSDFQNQINNSLVFPGIFRAINEHNIKEITMQMKLAAARAIAKLVRGEQRPDHIIADSLRKDVSLVISKEIGKK